MPRPLNENEERNQDLEWRLFEIHKASMAAVGKSQSRFVAALLGFLALLWGWHFMKPEGMTIQLLGASLDPAGLWTIAPAVLTVLTLGLIGTLNIMGPVWKRLGDSADRLGVKFFWTDLDTNKNIIDYLFFLKLWPEGPVEPTEPPTDSSRRLELTVFSYPLVLVAAITTTLFSDYPDSPWSVRAYIYGCAALQTAFSLRIWYRAVCRFFAARRPQTEV